LIRIVWTVGLPDRPGESLTVPVLVVHVAIARPLTSTGASVSAFDPSPSSPSPQHLTQPALVSAHVWPPPPLIAVTPLVRPLTSTGVGMI
jgi:hypothetical protein